MIETVISFDGHAFAPDYEADFVQGTEPGLPPIQVSLLECIGAWPVIVALQRKPRRVALLFKIMDYTNLKTLRAQLFRWLDPEDETPKKLIVENGDGVQQYVYALCEDLRLYSDPRHQEAFVATLAVDGDVRWRAETEDTDTWNITASGQTKALTNGGEDDAYPVFQITPTSAKTGGYLYKRWAPITWMSADPGAQYPVMASLDTAALVGAAKMQADGDDLRIYSDGIEIDRWLDAMNSAATKIWFSLNFAPTQNGTLKTAIAASGAITAIELNEDLTAWPASGIVLIGSEAFVFTNKDTSRQLLSGITRAAKGTSEAGHAIGAAVDWIQRDVWILYGDGTVGAPTTDNDYKPAFELDHSSNTSWVYETFGDDGELRAARWQRWGNVTLSGNGGCFTDADRTLESPYTRLGAWRDTQGGNAYGWYLENPCGITNAAWTNGWKRRADTYYLCHLMHWPRGATWWTWMYTPAVPVLPNGWETLTFSGAAFAVSNIIGIALYFYPSDFQISDVTVTLNSAETPMVTVGAEQSTYTLAATLTNSTTGELIQIAFECELNQTLEIDTYNKTVKYLKDNSSQFQAVIFIGPVRRNWLRLQPGLNTLTFDDAGTHAVTLITEWRERYY